MSDEMNISRKGAKAQSKANEPQRAPTTQKWNSHNNFMRECFVFFVLIVVDVVFLCAFAPLREN